MLPAHIVHIVTPKKARRAVVWVHGLGSSMFSKLEITRLIADKETAVLMFNNRGHDKISPLVVAGTKWRKAGSAHEKFTDCVDDIEGAIKFAKKAGAKSIYLAGHSTGCQKSTYWANKKGKGVKGIILLAPISDYAATVMLDSKEKIARALGVARRLVARGKKHELLPENVWGWSLLADAQRFISLYSGKGS